MNHIQLFEDFDNGEDIDPLTRELFGLTQTYTIQIDVPTERGVIKEEYCKITGPLENAKLAEVIVDEIKKGLERLADNSEGKYLDEFDYDDFLHEGEYYQKLKPLGYYFYHDGKMYYPKEDES